MLASSASPRLANSRGILKMLKIVGFGGSAGSFEAFEEILPTLPQGLNAAYVFITHLPRTHVSHIPTLFSKHTPMEVHCTDRALDLKADHLYVIAPHTFLCLEGNQLKPREREPGEPNRAINTFFTSLAKERGKDAVAVLLSGAGSDGALGMVRVRDAGGTNFTQNPPSAKYLSMPRTAMRLKAAGQLFTPDQLAFHLFRELSPKVSASQAS
ncbi:MAG: chemotaxis protein CheB [Proteobacteria bacterium]|nr:MAG: chemotaxis protein CheB [Pseudomonadota bacterium]